MDKFLQSSIKGVRHNLFQGTSVLKGDDFVPVFSENFFKEDKRSKTIKLPEKDRLNGLDSEIIAKNSMPTKKDTIKIEKEILKAKNFLEKNDKNTLLKRFFPELYKRRMLKKTLNQIDSLNKASSILYEKQIPYGESDKRYQNLIIYLSEVNLLQAKLNKKIAKS